MGEFLVSVRVSMLVNNMKYLFFIIRCDFLFVIWFAWFRFLMHGYGGNCYLRCIF
jgi:hypothetical protein